MKNITKWLVLPALLAALFWSCKKEENKDYYLGGTNMVLTASDTSLKLLSANANQNAITFNWTNPNYQFTTGTSSQNVNYTLQIDTLGSNFSNPNMFTISIASNLSKTFTVDEINSDLSNNIGLATDVPHTVQMRVVSSLGSANTALLYSNVLQYKVTPYSPPPVVTPPSSGALFLVGSATAGGWNNPVPVPTQQFTKISNTMYKITVALIGGQEFLILPVNGDWGHKYAVKDKTAGGLTSGGSFGLDLSDNIPGPTASGTYAVTVDFQKGVYTVVKQ